MRQFEYDVLLPFPVEEERSVCILLPDNEGLSDVLSLRGIRAVTVELHSTTRKQTTQDLSGPWKEHHDTYMTTGVHWPTNVPLVVVNLTTQMFPRILMFVVAL